jgi:hypothetical protein
MKRFLMVAGVVCVGGALYVASAPAGQQAAPMARQFKALVKQVAGLKKSFTEVKKLATDEGLLLVDCMAVAVPVNQFGDATNQTEGYHYRQADTSEILTTALDASSDTDPNAVWFTGGTSSCGTDVNGALRHHLAALTGVRLPHAAQHVHPFTAHRP